MQVTGIDTITISEAPSLLIVRLRTDEGVVGYADTWYAADALRAYIHDWMAPRLLGRDPRRIERIWFELHDRDAARFGGLGLEMRALSAIDVALWDILGQAAGQPIWQLLGGAFTERLRVYNTCAGPLYGRPGWSRDGEGAGELEDLTAFLTDAGALARSLLADGFGAMKIWPFDRFGLANDGRFISADQLAEGLRPIQQIRDAVGDRIEVMIEGHGYWDLPTAVRIARALEPYRPAWLEDMVLAHDVNAIRRLRESTSIPILGSELLVTRRQYKPLLDAEAVDIVMVDPTWAGGITESHKIASLADSYSLPVAMHDCTGPFTLLAGIHLGISAPNALYQEVVRAYLRTWYRDLVTELPRIEDGHVLPPTGSGIGAALAQDVEGRPGVVVRSTDLAAV
jgi:L-alanine-DL-glutamate epimerase-like enolase superfamily enzyme